MRQTVLGLTNGQCPLLLVNLARKGCKQTFPIFPSRPCQARSLTYCDYHYLGVAYRLGGTYFRANSLVSGQASKPQSGHACFVYVEIYIEALLIDEELADQV